MTCFQKHLLEQLNSFKIPYQNGNLGIFSCDGHALIAQFKALSFDSI